MWPSMHTHYNETTDICDPEDETALLNELFSVDAEKLISIKQTRIGDNMPLSSNISVHQIHAARIWIKKGVLVQLLKILNIFKKFFE